MPGGNKNKDSLSMVEPMHSFISCSSTLQHNCSNGWRLDKGPVHAGHAL